MLRDYAPTRHRTQFGGSLSPFACQALPEVTVIFGLYVPRRVTATFRGDHALANQRRDAPMDAVEICLRLPSRQGSLTGWRCVSRSIRRGIFFIHPVGPRCRRFGPSRRFAAAARAINVDRLPPE